jgi:hypothetical protein
MLDKILGKKDKDKNDTPDLRKNGKKSDSDNSDIGGRLKDMVGKVSGKSKDKDSDKPKSTNGKVKLSNGDKKVSPDNKIPRPMPKPKPKPQLDKPRLRTPEKKKPGAFAGLGGGLGKQLPEEDQRTLVGAAVFGIILIILVGAGYYFLVYSPYQQTLVSAQNAKISEVNSYFKGGLANDPNKNSLLLKISTAQTPDQALAVDVIGPATTDWRNYQTQQITNKSDPYGRVQISYSTQPTAASGTAADATASSANVKNLIVKAADAQTIVNEADASVLANMDITTPDTVAIPVYLSRIQAAGGLLNVGDSVDVYQNVNTSAATTGNNTTVAPTTTSTTAPEISGATVLAILRDTTSSSDYNANLSCSTAVSIGGAGLGVASGSAATGTVEQVLQAGASGNWNQAQINTLLTAYGWKLSNFERVSNLGNMNANYLVVLEVPRANALWVIQNDNFQASSSLYLVVPTQSAPTWMIQELHQIYGS